MHALIYESWINYGREKPLAIRYSFLNLSVLSEHVLCILSCMSKSFGKSEMRDRMQNERMYDKTKEINPIRHPEHVIQLKPHETTY